MNIRGVASRRFWGWYWPYRRHEAEPYEAVNLRDAYVAGWFAGGAYVLKSSAQIIDLVPTIDLFNELLAAELIDRTREAEPGFAPDPAHSHHPSGEN